MPELWLRVFTPVCVEEGGRDGGCAGATGTAQVTGGWARWPARPWGQLMAVSGGWANSAKEPSESSLWEFLMSGVLYSLLVDSASLSAVYINVRFQDRVSDHQGTRRNPEGGQPAQDAAIPLAHKCICPCSPPIQ